MERSSRLIQGRFAFRRSLAGALAAGGVLLFGTGASQQTPPGAFVNDAAGNRVLWHCKELLWETEGKEIVFTGTGDPVYGAWKRQNMNLEVKRFTGRTGKDKFSLLSATLEGAAKAMLTRSSASGEAGKTQDIELRAAKAVYQSKDEKWTLTGGVSVHRTDAPALNDTLIKGETGVVNLYPAGAAAEKGSQGIKSATLDSATLTMKTQRREEVEGSPGKFEMRLYTFEAKADNLEFDDATHTIALTGNVHFSGDDPLTAGEIGQVTKAVITLDENGRPKRIKAEGAPGVTKLRQKPPPLGISLRDFAPSRLCERSPETQARDLRLRASTLPPTANCQLPTSSTLALRPSPFGATA